MPYGTASFQTRVARSFRIGPPRLITPLLREEMRPARGAPGGALRLVLTLALAVAIPILLFAGWIAYTGAQQERNAARSAAFEIVERVAERVASQVATELQVLEALATSTALDDGNLAAFYREAERIKSSRVLWHTVELAAPSGAQLLNLLRPMGDPLTTTADRDSFDKVVATKQPVIGGIGPVGRISGRRLVTLRVPVIRESELRYTLSVGIVPDEISAVLRESGSPPDWVGVVVDARGHIVARTLAEQTELGLPASASARLAVTRAPNGFYRGLTLEGLEVDTVYRTLPNASGWSVHFGIPSDSLNAPVRRSLYLLAAEGGASVLLAMVLAAFVARDLAQRRRDDQQRAENALRASEERRLVAVEAAELGTWRWDLQEDALELSAQSRAFLHLIEDTALIEDAARGTRIFRYGDLLEAVHPADRAVLDTAIQRCRREGSPIDVEFRAVHPSGAAHWLRAIGRASQTGAGKGKYIHGVIADIDSRKRADAERLSLLRRLAQAQEDERRRIARELHDQIGQTVTGLSLGLKGIEQAVERGTTHAALRDRVKWLQALAADIGRDIHRTAADLRPTALDDLGLYDALRAYAADWSARYAITVDVQSVGNIQRLSTEVETVVYRTVQEALTNVLKHAAARNVSVLLEQKGDQLRLIIEDDGRGFDPAEGGLDRTAPDARPRLGLSGIRERLSLIGGTMTVESAPGAGTTLFVQVPTTPFQGALP